MSHKQTGNSGSSEGCCKIEGVISVDERGQMVLPKDIREKANIKPGDKLAVVCLERDGAVCCLTLLKVENLSGLVKSLIGPVLGD